uniref:hypothetical protein n=1 Tax=Trichocoleus desertorum TaxID=1481672 RepID=UPI0025B5C278|nr:hypothetical protein [Trichocoleus desertorum]
MGNGGFDLVDNYAIHQGAGFGFAILYPGDITSWTFKGEVRKGESMTSDLLASFVFGAATYDGSKTTVPVSLPHAQTLTLRPTLGSSRYFYDVIGFPPVADPVWITGGQTQVKAGVTEINV